MFNINHIISTGGVLIIAAMIFGESGMFLGFFFPGDTLLIGAGVFAATGKLSMAALIPAVAIAAIAGDNVGYNIGRRYGRKLFKKPDSLFFKQEHVQRAELFYERYGAKTMLFAHFIPVIRTFAPPVAGVGKMRYRNFIIFDAIGDTAWAAIVSSLGYYFGSKIPNIDHYVLLAVGSVVVITLTPTIFQIGKILLKKRADDKKS